MNIGGANKSEISLYFLAFKNLNKNLSLSISFNKALCGLIYISLTAQYFILYSSNCSSLKYFIISFGTKTSKRFNIPTIPRFSSPSKPISCKSSSSTLEIFSSSLLI